MGWIADLLKEIPSAARYKAELEELASEHDALKSENGTLKKENDDLHAKLEATEHQMKMLTTPTEPKSNRRTETDERILLLLSHHGSAKSTQIAQHIGTSVDRAKVYLAELKDAELIYYKVYINREGTWNLNDNGRKYLVTNDLIQ